MDAASIAVLDNISEFDDVIEVDYRPYMQETRTIIGLYAGLERAERGAWYLLVHDKACIRTIDVVAVRRLTTEAV